MKIPREIDFFSHFRLIYETHTYDGFRRGILYTMHRGPIFSILIFCEITVIYILKECTIPFDVLIIVGSFFHIEVELSSYIWLLLFTSATIYEYMIY